MHARLHDEWFSYAPRQALKCVWILHGSTVSCFADATLSPVVPCTHLHLGPLSSFRSTFFWEVRRNPENPKETHYWHPRDVRHRHYHLLCRVCGVIYHNQNQSAIVSLCGSEYNLRASITFADHFQPFICENKSLKFSNFFSTFKNNDVSLNSSNIPPLGFILDVELWIQIGRKVLINLKN